MPKLIYSGDELTAAVLDKPDLRAVTYALRAALLESPHPDLKPDMERVLRDLTMPAPKGAR